MQSKSVQIVISKTAVYFHTVDILFQLFTNSILADRHWDHRYRRQRINIPGESPVV